MSGNVNKIKESMKTLLGNYRTLINGKNKVPFWDLIVISAQDEAQKQCYELQLKSARQRRELPETQIIVIPDPPGPVMGAGGSTVHILSQLFQTYADNLFTMRLLLMHSGGSSKRLPNFSCVGKLFTPLPIQLEAGQLFTVLNMKLALTAPFAKCLTNGGLFITACDDIETYCLDGLDDLGTFPDDAVVALAHPSDLFIGQTHGVYVIHPKSSGNNSICWRTRCIEVLQKPSVDIMREKKAVFPRGLGERTYTDSMFWCGPSVVRRLLSLSRSFDILSSGETCVYADLLACMGERPKSEKLYFQKLPEDSEPRKLIAEEFHETPLEVVVLEESHFYHLGTMEEYIDNLRPDSEFFQSFPMRQLVNCSGEFLNGSEFNGVAMSCRIDASTTTGKNSVLDFCRIEVPLRIGENSIISNCFVGRQSTEIHEIPSGFLMHTAAISDRDELFVTMAFSIDDELKNSAKNPDDVQFSKGPITNLGIPVEDLWDQTEFSLWKAKLFEAKPSMSESFQSTYDLCFRQKAPRAKRYSMADLVRLKSVQGFLEFRQSLIQ